MLTKEELEAAVGVEAAASALEPLVVTEEPSGAATTESSAPVVEGINENDCGVDYGGGEEDVGLKVKLQAHHQPTLRRLNSQIGQKDVVAPKQEPTSSRRRPPRLFTTSGILLHGIGWGILQRDIVGELLQAG